MSSSKTKTQSIAAKTQRPQPGWALYGFIRILTLILLLGLWIAGAILAYMCSDVLFPGYLVPSLVIAAMVVAAAYHLSVQLIMLGARIAPRPTSSSKD